MVRGTVVTDAPGPSGDRPAKNPLFVPPQKVDRLNCPPPARTSASRLCTAHGAIAGSGSRPPHIRVQRQRKSITIRGR